MPDLLTLFPWTRRWVLAGHLDARVDEGVRDVHHEVGDEVYRRDHDPDAHDGGKVERGGAPEGVEAQAGPGEDALDDYRARQEPAETQADDRDHGDQGIPRGVAQRHRALVEALGARGSHVV